MREDEDKLSSHPFSLNSDPGVNNAYLSPVTWPCYSWYPFLQHLILQLQAPLPKG